MRGCSFEPRSPRKEIGKGLLAKILAGPGIDRDDLRTAESEARRMLNPEHSTKAATIDRALRRMGKRVTVTVGEAA